MMDATIDKVRPDFLVSTASVYDFSDRDWKPGDLLTADDLLAYEKEHHCAVGEDEIAIINFGWYKRYWRSDGQSQWYANNSPGMTEDAVVLLKDRGIRAVGTDTIACDTGIVEGQPTEAPGHMKYWLPNHILIIESLANLEQVTPRCIMVATPLNIECGSGSPIRPVAYCPK